MLARVFYAAAAAASAVAVLALAALAAVTVIDVGGRYLFNKPLMGAIELTEFLMVILSFGGLALAELRNSHISVDFFVAALPGRARALLDAAGALLGVVFWGFVAWRATVHSGRVWAFGEVSANLAVPVWPFYLAVTVGCGLLVVGADRPRDPLAARRTGLMDTTTIGVLGFAAMLALMFLGVPIGVAMGAVGFFGFAWVNGWNSALNMLALAPYSAVATYVLSVVPLFVLMGHLANETGIGRELYATAQTWLKHRRGGLAMATVAACAGFAAISGSSVATAATMTTVALPQMRKMGYDPRLATGSVAAGGTLGILIPPSVIFLIYGFLTETSIGKLFLAGVLPGILLTVLFVFTIAIVTWHNPKLAPTVQERASFADRLKALREVWAVAALFTLVIGGMYGGVFTATEAAGIGAFGTLILALMRGRLTWATLWRSLASTAETVAIITVILVGAVVLGYFLAVTQLPMKLSQALADSGLSPTSIMLMIIAAYLIMGAFMDELAMILLTVPILFPVTQALGYDPVWFGVIIVIVCQAGMIAPPVGLNVFVISGMVKDVPMQDIYRGILPFLAAMVVLLGLLMAAPEIALYLPRTMK